MRNTFVLMFLVAGLALPAAGQQQQTPTPLRPIKTFGDAAHGEALAKRWCTSCHSLGDKSSATDQVPSFRWIAEQTQKDPAFIRAFLTMPHTPMPPLDLSRQEIEDFVAYFREIGKP